jgi:hypothetical protein
MHEACLKREHQPKHGKSHTRFPFSRALQLRQRRARTPDGQQLHRLLRAQMNSRRLTGRVRESVQRQANTAPALLLPNYAALFTCERIVSIDLAGESRPAREDISQNLGFSFILG